MQKPVEAESTGRWQVALLVLVGCNYMFVSINHVLPSFHGYTPPFHCQIEEGGNVTRVDGCLTETEVCATGYQFESARNENSIVTEWGLVCSRRLLRPLVATLYFCGVTLGAPLGGMMADRHGRRLVMLTCLYCQGALGLALYFTDSLVAFIVVRFIQGIFVQGLQGSTYTLLMELFPPKGRTAVGIVLEVYWALGLSVLAACAYFLPDWRTLQLALTLPTLLTLPYICFVPESPRWLMTRGRYIEAEKALRKIARLNGFAKEEKENPKQQPYSNGDAATPYNTHTSLPDNLYGDKDVNIESNRKDAVIVGYSLKDNGIASRRNSPLLSTTNTCFKDGNVTDQEILPCSNVDMVSPDKDIPLGNGRTGVPTKQDVIRVNSVANSDGLDVKVQSVATQGSNGCVLDLFTNRLMRKYSSLMIFIWFSVSLSYYGIIFYMPDLSGDRHLNFFMGAVLEAVSYCVAYFVLSRLGRRFPQTGYLLVSGLLCVAVGVLSTVKYSVESSSYSSAQTVLALLGKAAVVSSFCTIFIYTTELFPTVVRAAAFGYCAFGGRVGSLLAPQLLLLGEYTSTVVPLVTMGALVVLAGVATLLLPETLGRPLPDTIEQAEDMNTKKLIQDNTTKN